MGDDSPLTSSTKRAKADIGVCSFNAVVSTNEAAVPLWKSFGFEVVGTVPRVFRHQTESLVPIYVMYRDL